MSKFFKLLGVLMLFIVGACTHQTEKAAVHRYAEPRFNNQKPIELLVNKVDIVSDFTPSFTKPNVEHLFPVSIERAARVWATDSLQASDYSRNRTAEFIIKDASVVENEVKAADLFHKDSLKYRATLSTTLKIVDANGSVARTSLDAWRELSIPIDTQIDEKEKYWHEMVENLISDFNVKMRQNIEEHLNMYVKDNSLVLQY
ncbi:MAG: hypothetical protein IJS26_04015 [Alphaproteobacteria bacterium]|nr:hypothetical protein [Alphaproteobacteria bacterium]